MPLPVLIILILILAAVGPALAYILLIIVSSLFVNPHKLYDHNSRYYRFLLHSSTAMAMFLIRIKIHTTGLDKLPEGRFLIVGNHRSKFDPIVTWHVLRHRDLAYISKGANFSVPAYGRIIRKCCFMDIDRERAMGAITTVNHAAELLKADEVSIGMYPEGTRNFNQGTLKKFHDGSLKAALWAKCPIAVVIMTGTHDIDKNWLRRRTHVTLEVVQVLSYEEIKDLKTNEIADKIKDIMQKKLDEHYAAA
jgi:1-acyl-sn-glycerol-3-phosphate acyltransferase